MADVYAGTASQQRPPLTDKLWGILKRIDSDGKELERNAESLADKLSGTVPEREMNEPPPRSRDNVHDIVDIINDRLTSLFSDMRASLERGHRSIGSVNPSEPSPDYAPIGTGKATSARY